MLRRLRPLMCAAVLGVAAASWAGQQSLAPPSQQSQLAGSARITGRVVAADDAAPVRRVLIHLSGHPSAEPEYVRLTREVETDGNGRFDFTGLPAGRYAVYTQQRIRGFVTLGRHQEATLTALQVVDLTIRLQRAGAIEGTILDEHGDGMLGMEVEATGRFDIGSLTFGTSSRAVARTDDRGRYRIFNLPAGEYYVTAEEPVVGGSHQPPPPAYGYPLTYYPGSSSRNDARAVLVRGGRDTQHIDFALPRRRLATLTIKAVNSRGERLGSDARATLNKRGDFRRSVGDRDIVVRDDGGFVIQGVKPGDYDLIVSTGLRMEEAVVVRVPVNEADQTLSVRTNVGARVSGRVIVDGRPADGVPNTSVHLWSPSGTYGYPYMREYPRVQLKGTDRFELQGLRGPMVLSADVYLGALLSIRQGGEDLTGKTIELVGTEALDDVVVELTTRVATLDVRITGGSATDDTDPVLLVMFPEDSALWHQPFVTQRSATGSRNRVDVQRVVPGRYLVVALDSAGINNPTEPALLELLRPLATPVTLVASQTATVDLPITKLPRLK